MASFKECMDRAVNGGVMSKSRAESAKKAYDLYARDLQPADAQARVVQDAGAVAQNQRRRLEANAAAQKKIKAKIDAGLPLWKIVEDFSHKGSLRFRHETVRADLRSQMNDVLKTFRSNIVGGRRNKATLQNLVRELYGKNTGDGAASELAKSFRAAQERAKKLFEDAGGFVRTKVNYGLPQSHSQVRVGKTDAETWVNDVWTLIDKDQLTDDLGNVLPETAAKDALRAMHEHISSGGWASRDKSQFGGAYKLGERRVDPDYLPFKDGESWLAYAQQYGEQTDPWRVMVGYIDNMAHQIAEAEVLGIDADATWAFAREEFLGKHRGSDKAKATARHADDMRDVWSGVTQEPQNRIWARVGSSVRQYLASTQLGSAFLSSVSDVGVARGAAAFTGMSKSGHLRGVKQLIRSKEFRENARELGLVLENAIDMGQAAHRYSMEDFTTETAARLSDFTMRASFLSGWTQMSRDAVGMSALNDLAKARGKGFTDLEPRMRQTLEAFDISGDVWDKIRKSEVKTVKGVDFLSPDKIEAVAGRDAALSVMEFINALQARAVLTTSIQSRAGVTGTTRPGSVAGEALRTIAQYKTFPIEFLLRPIGQIVDDISAGEYRSAVDQAARTAIMMTLLGAVALQAKETVKGRNPREMDDLEFWKAAALQGGGLGIFGDFLFADHNRFGQSIAQSIAGPTVGLVGDALKLSVGNVTQAVQGEETNFGRELVKFTTDYTPAQSLWYARLAFERAVEDNLMRLVDADAQSRFNARIRKSQKDGSGYWLQPGALNAFE